MPKGAVIRFRDYERTRHDADGAAPRDPADSAVIIILPVVRIERIVSFMTADDGGFCFSAKGKRK